MVPFASREPLKLSMPKAMCLRLKPISHSADAAHPKISLGAMARTKVVASKPPRDCLLNFDAKVADADCAMDLSFVAIFATSCSNI